MKNTKIDKLIYKMITENTGHAFMDSGDAYGRNYERNQKKTIQDFINEPSVSVDRNYDEEIYIEISLFHYLRNGFELDSLCDKFNKRIIMDWDADIYGIDKDSQAWLIKNGFILESTDNSEYSLYEFNTYNDDSFSNMVQGIQGHTIYHEPTKTCYTLLQTHNGADIRGGYTDAKLFKYDDIGIPSLSYGGTLTIGKKTIQVNNDDYNYGLIESETEKPIESIQKNAKIELSLF